MTKTGRLGLLLFLYGLLMPALYMLRDVPMTFGIWWYGLNVLIGGALFVLDEPKEKKP